MNKSNFGESHIKPKILHVDDSPDILNLFHIAYRQYFEIESASGYEEAIKTLEKSAFEVVVTDYDMPDKNGLHLLKTIKEQNPDTPVIFYTGRGNEHIAREAFIMGAYDYFTKEADSPAYREKIINSILTAAQRRRDWKNLRPIQDNEQEDDSIEIMRDKAKWDVFLESTRQTYGALFDATSNLLFIFDQKTLEMINLNLKACNAFGFSREKFLDIGISPICCDEIPYTLDTLYEKLNNGIRKGNERFEWRITDIKGEFIWLDMNISPVKIMGRECLMMVGNDVTYRKKMEQDLSLSESNYRAIFEAVTDGISIHDAVTGKLLEVNEKLCQTYGYTKDELMKLKIKDITYSEPPYTEYTAEKGFQKTLDAQKTGEMSFEWICKKKNGEPFWANIDLSFVDLQQKKVMLSILHNINERKSAKEALVKSRKQYQSLFKYMSSSFVWLEVVADENDNPVDLIFKEVNQSFENLFNAKNQDLAGKSVFEIYPMLQKPDFNAVEIAGKVGITGESIHFERYSTLMGKHFAVSIFSPEKYFVAVILDDITQRIKDQQDLLNKNKELANFTHIVSHELKSPLNLLRGYFEAIADDAELFSKFFPRVMAQSDRLLKFIDNMLKVSKAGKVIGEKSIIRSENLLREIFLSLKPEGLPAKLIIESPIPSIIGDLHALRISFSNIIQNAILHRDPQKEELVINISHKIEDDNITFLLEDNGKGIREEYIEKIFDMGFTLGQDKGTGFGLVIAQKIIEAHEGSIWAQSDGIGCGVKIYVRLPLKNPEEIDS